MSEPAKFKPFLVKADRAVEIGLAFQELAALDKEVVDYLNAEKKASDDYEDRKSKKLNHAVPSIPDLKTRCKTIFQKADQAYQAQLALIRIFYPDFGNKSYYTKWKKK